MKKIKFIPNNLVYIFNLFLLILYCLLLKNVWCRDAVGIADYFYWNEHVAEFSSAGNWNNRLNDGNAFKNTYKPESPTSLPRETLESSVKNQVDSKIVKEDKSREKLLSSNEVIPDAQPLEKSSYNPNEKTKLDNKKKNFRRKSQWLLNINRRVTNSLKGLVEKIKLLIRKVQRKPKYEGYIPLKKNVISTESSNIPANLRLDFNKLNKDYYPKEKIISTERIDSKASDQKSQPILEKQEQNSNQDKELDAKFDDTNESNSESPEKHKHHNPFPHSSEEYKPKPKSQKKSLPNLDKNPGSQNADKLELPEAQIKQADLQESTIGSTPWVKFSDESADSSPNESDLQLNSWNDLLKDSAKNLLNKASSNDEKYSSKPWEELLDESVKELIAHASINNPNTHLVTSETKTDDLAKNTPIRTSLNDPKTHSPPWEKHLQQSVKDLLIKASFGEKTEIKSWERLLEESVMKSSSETSTKIVFSTENHSKIAEELSHLKLQKYENQDLKSKKIDYLPGYEHSTTIGKDGNCQFRAISLILHNNQERHEVVRSEVVDYIKTHRNYYEVFILPIKFEDYVEEMSKNGNWGDEITLRAAIEIYKLRVFVLSESENGAYVKKYGKVVKSNEVFSGIFFKSKHYEILLQTNEN